MINKFHPSPQRGNNHCVENHSIKIFGAGTGS